MGPTPKKDTGSRMLSRPDQGPRVGGFLSEVSPVPGPNSDPQTPTAFSRPPFFISPYSPCLPISLQLPTLTMLSWMKTGLGLAACKTSGGELRWERVKPASWGDLGAGQPTLLCATFHSRSLSLTHSRDQREEELGEYYMKKYAKSSVGET